MIDSMAISLRSMSGISNGIIRQSALIGGGIACLSGCTPATVTASSVALSPTWTGTGGQRSARPRSSRTVRHGPASGLVPITVRCKATVLAATDRPSKSNLQAVEW